uniref:Uncharacterized protein n=1 Tax=Anguilla anguilla TaxID=7936 RepID=A0A0E9SC62_ANGAN
MVPIGLIVYSVRLQDDCTYTSVLKLCVQIAGQEKKIVGWGVA